MEKLKPQYYFDLSTFQHAVIFDGCENVWQPLGRIADYLMTLPLGSCLSRIPDGAYIDNLETVYIGEGCTIEPGVYIQGPCWIGDGSSVRHGAYVRGNVITGRRCVIGHASELKNALLLDDAHAAHFAYVGDSILGNRVNLGAGVKLANLKLRRGEVILQVTGRRVATLLRKFGAILGDDTQLGCNSVTNPGTLCGKGVLTIPCLSIGGFVPSGTFIRNGAGIAHLTG